MISVESCCLWCCCHAAGPSNVTGLDASLPACVQTCIERLWTDTHSCRPVLTRNAEEPPAVALQQLKPEVCVIIPSKQCQRQGISTSLQVCRSCSPPCCTYKVASQESSQLNTVCVDTGSPCVAQGLLDCCLLGVQYVLATEYLGLTSLATVWSSDMLSELSALLRRPQPRATAIL